MSQGAPEPDVESPAGAGEGPEREEPPLTPPSPFVPSLETIVKFAAAPGVIVFAILFVAYRRYYSGVGIDPEDAGIDSAYVLSRSLGLVLLIVGYLALSGLTAFLDHLTSDGRPATAGRRLHRVATASYWAVQAVLAGVIVYLFVPVLSLFTVGAGLLLTLLIVLPPDSWFRGFRPYQQVVRVTVGAIVGSAVLMGLLNGYAGHQAADRALRGCHVEPLVFHGIPILEISATTARIDWIGTKEARPPDLAADPNQTWTYALVVGRGTAVSYLREDPSGIVLVQVPATLVTVRSLPGSSKDLQENLRCGPLGPT